MPPASPRRPDATDLPSSGGKRAAPTGSRVLLYVGAPKTGTTSVQAFLRTNQDRLTAQGVFVPKAGRGGGDQHLELPVIVNSQGRRNGLERHANLKATDDIQALRSKFIANLESELATAPAWHTILVFSEYMFSSLPREIKAYREIFSPYASKLDSIMYLRRQDQWLASLTLQARKTGTRTDLKLHAGSPERFAEGVRGWAVGSDTCHIRRLDPAFMLDASLLPDFCGAAGIDTDGMDMTEVRANPAALQEQIELLDALNTKIAFIRFKDQVHYRTRLINLMVEILGGSRVQFAREQATRTFQSFNKINSWLRTTRDPSGPESFFNEDFSGYAEEPDNANLYSIEQLKLLMNEISNIRKTQGLTPTSLKRTDDRSANIDRIITAFMELRRVELVQWRKEIHGVPSAGAGNRAAGRSAPKKFARVLLFIGAPDPTTSALQGILRKSRSKLMQQGVFVPLAGRAGQGQHIELPACFLREETLGDLGRNFDLNGETPAERALRLRREIDDELSAAAECHTMLLFSEHIFYSDPAEIADYQAFFARYSRNLNCLVYLRRQDHWLIDLRLRARSTMINVPATWNPVPPEAYFARLRGWSDAANICSVRRYEPEFVNPNGITDDLAEAIGVHPRGLVAAADREPLAPLHEQFELIDAVNESIADLPFRRQVVLRKGFLSLVTEVLGGAQYLPRRQRARAIFDSYEEVNRWLAKRYDATGPDAFFFDGFDEYAKVATPSPIYSGEELERLLGVVMEKTISVTQPVQPAGTGRKMMIDAIAANFIALRRAEVASSRVSPPQGQIAHVAA